MKYAVNVSENAVVGLPMKISLRDLKIVLSAEDLILSTGKEIENIITSLYYVYIDVKLNIFKVCNRYSQIVL